MRFHSYCVGLLLVLLSLVGCGDFELAPCGWGCGDGKRCVDSECVACGGPGEVCCNQNVGGDFCTEPGYGCDSADGPGTCSKDCGSAGKPCCDGSECDEPNNVTCNINEVCDSFGGGGGASCFDGSNAFTFTIIFADCGKFTQTFFTNTLEEAEDCAEQNGFVAGPGEEVCEVNETADTAHVCKDGETFGIYFDHCSAEQLVACQNFFCDTCSWAECP